MVEGGTSGEFCPGQMYTVLEDTQIGEGRGAREVWTGMLLGVWAIVEHSGPDDSIMLTIGDKTDNPDPPRWRVPRSDMVDMIELEMLVLHTR